MSSTTSPGPRRAVLRSVVDRVIPGVARVRAQKEPFAAAWRAANAAALPGDGPLWVALGDSMTQGIGAAGISGGWVSQLRDRLAAQGRPVRLVNLSATGARVRVYVPYGKEWYGYLMRRLAERPANLTFFARSLITKG